MNPQVSALTQPRTVVAPRSQANRFPKEFKRTLLISFAHLPLGVILYNAGSLALLHPIAVFSLGVAWAYQKRVGLERVAVVAGYLIGSEVLWRMAKIPVPWEFGKYGSAAIIFIALVTRRRYRFPRLALIYFFVLLPSCFFTIAEFDIGFARAQISSNLSGPFLLAMSCWFFANVRMTTAQLRRLMFAVLIPLLSVACSTLFYTVTSEEIVFNTESNFATSGGFGPNQVSAMLGLGVFVAAACLIIFKLDVKFKAFLAAAAIFFAAQSVMTFSRGGIYNAIGALLALTFFQFQNFTEAVKRVVPGLILVAIFFVFVFPALDNFTGGKLQERFDDTDTTNRADIAESDLAIFLEYPIFGVGVGSSSEYRKQILGYGAGSHTEFSRLISEHGFFGIAALISIFLMATVNFKRQRSTFGRSLVAGVAVWCGLFMFNAGMRLAAPSYLWGLTFITIVDQRLARRRVLLRGRKAAAPQLQPPVE